jgi:hypothetical protein
LRWAPARTCSTKTSPIRTRHHDQNMYKPIASSPHTFDRRGSRTEPHKDQGVAIAATPTDDIHSEAHHTHVDLRHLPARNGTHRRTARGIQVRHGHAACSGGRVGKYAGQAAEISIVQSGKKAYTVTPIAVVRLPLMITGKYTYSTIVPTAFPPHFTRALPGRAFYSFQYVVPSHQCCRLPCILLVPLSFCGFPR